MKYDVKESGIHGKGLFAIDNIEEGEIIGSIKFDPTEEDGPHVLWVENQGILVEHVSAQSNKSSP